MTKVYSIKKDRDGRWTWRVRGQRSEYFTDCSGRGVFCEDDVTGNGMQLVGLYQFAASESAADLKTQLSKMFD